MKTQEASETVELVTAREAQAICLVSSSTFYRHVAPELSVVRLSSRRTAFKRSEINDWIARRTTPPANA